VWLEEQEDVIPCVPYWYGAFFETPVSYTTTDDDNAVTEKSCNVCLEACEVIGKCTDVSSLNGIFFLVFFLDP